MYNIDSGLTKLCSEACFVLCDKVIWGGFRACRVENFVAICGDYFNSQTALVYSKVVGALRDFLSQEFKFANKVFHFLLLLGGQHGRDKNPVSSGWAAEVFTGG